MRLSTSSYQNEDQQPVSSQFQDQPINNRIRDQNKSASCHVKQYGCEEKVNLNGLLVTEEPPCRAADVTGCSQDQLPSFINSPSVKGLQLFGVSISTS